MTSSISRIESLIPLSPLEANDTLVGERWPPARVPSRLHDNFVEPAPRARASIPLSRPPSALVETGSTQPASPAPLANARFTEQPQLTDVASGHIVLGPGSRGDGLRAVQTALLKMGFALPGGADGHFGAQTQRALRNFQTHAGLTFPTVKPTGLLDSATLHALDALAPEPGMRGQSQGVPPATYDGQPVRVIVALREHRTFLYDTEGRVVDIVPNASGTTTTPTRPGLKVVRTRLHQAAAEAAGERLWNDRSVFGARILDLSWADGRHSGEELHGTNAPALLGGDVSHGCIRHSNEAIIALHDALSVGDRVAIVEHVNDPRLGAQAPVSRGTTLPRAAPSARAPAG
ncbi:L,D-transpeptidase family protein [Myxococcus landrumensis]|uniref:Murein L,D-transpeptidase n=1 Tax=Myxococcus landrumensis TaxID=2813577 RepID=A0ABX7N4G8_9BACT|nr:L,D-transpeptidase family protein [Myxococcus landrumus]QSQ13605.1 murein L,D-transpeptidase [Myxococcus landrumus]